MKIKDLLSKLNAANLKIYKTNLLSENIKMRVVSDAAAKLFKINEYIDLSTTTLRFIRNNTIKLENIDGADRYANLAESLLLQTSVTNSDVLVDSFVPKTNNILIHFVSQLKTDIHDYYIPLLDETDYLFIAELYVNNILIASKQFDFDTEVQNSDGNVLPMHDIIFPKVIESDNPVTERTVLLTIGSMFKINDNINLRNINTVKLVIKRGVFTSTVCNEITLLVTEYMNDSLFANIDTEILAYTEEEQSESAVDKVSVYVSSVNNDDIVENPSNKMWFSRKNINGAIANVTITIDSDERSAIKQFFNLQTDGSVYNLLLNSVGISIESREIFEIRALPVYNSVNNSLYSVTYNTDLYFKSSEGGGLTDTFEIEQYTYTIPVNTMLNLTAIGKTNFVEACWSIVNTTYNTFTSNVHAVLGDTYYSDLFISDILLKYPFINNNPFINLGITAFLHYSATIDYLPIDTKELIIDKTFYIKDVATDAAKQIPFALTGIAQEEYTFGTRIMITGWPNAGLAIAKATMIVSEIVQIQNATRTIYQPTSNITVTIDFPINDVDLDYTNGSIVDNYAAIL